MTFRRAQPTQGKKLSLSKSADTARIDYNRERPTFCLRFVDSSYCITSCSHEDKAAFADKLRRMSLLTWNELINAPRHGMGFETIRRSEIRRPMPVQITEDVTLIAFRFSGKNPMFGYRMDGMFHIVWFDCNFDLYDHS